VRVFKTIDKLSEMLNTYGIKHTFIYSSHANEEDKDMVVTLCFSKDDYMTVCLIYALYSKVYRSSRDVRLAGCLLRVANRIIDNDNKAFFQISAEPSSEDVKNEFREYFQSMYADIKEASKRYVASSIKK